MLGKTNVKVKPNKKVDYDNYIQSTGTQYINTGIVPKSTTRMEIKLKYNDIEGFQQNGWGSSAGAEAFIVGINGTLGTFCSWISSNYLPTSTGIAKDTKIHIFDVKSGSQKFDGVEFGTDTIGNTASSNQTMYLFGLHGEWNTEPVALCKCNFYYCKIYDGDALVRDFRPCKDGVGVYCLYDEVEKRYYYNQGTGEFIGGASV